MDYESIDFNEWRHFDDRTLDDRTVGPARATETKGRCANCWGRQRDGRTGTAIGSASNVSSAGVRLRERPQNGKRRGCISGGRQHAQRTHRTRLQVRRESKIRAEDPARHGQGPKYSSSNASLLAEGGTEEALLGPEGLSAGDGWVSIRPGMRVFVRVGQPASLSTVAHPGGVTLAPVLGHLTSGSWSRSSFQNATAAAW